MSDSSGSWGSTVSAIDRDSELPYYEQIRRTIIAAVEAGEIVQGDAIPGEYELCRIFGVSRTAVRQALGSLEHDGMITRVKGKGTFLSATKARETIANRLAGLFEDVTERGGIVTSRILVREYVPADAHIATQLELEPGADVLVLERLRFVDGLPWSLSTTWLPRAVGELLDDADLEGGSLYRALEAEGVMAVSGQRVLDAVMADARTAELLEVEPDSPAMRLASVTRDGSGVPIESFVALHRGDMSSFVFDIGSSVPTAYGMRVDPAS